MEQFFDIQNQDSFFWILAGIILILIEISAVPGIGFLFAGLGAMTLGAFLVFGLFDINGSFEHIAYFFFLTTVWAVILWVPLKSAMRQKEGEGYKNMVGTSAIVDEELIEGKISYVKWSGTSMRARIVATSTTKKIAKGETVWVHKNKDGVLHVDTEEA